MAKIINTQTIRFKENGNDIQGYNFNVNTGDFSTMINLTPGSHSYENNSLQYMWNCNRNSNI